MTLRDERFHIAVEESQKQRRNMGAVHIRIGHDNDFSVPGFGNIKIFTNAAAKGGNHIFNLITGQHTVQTGFFHI